MLHTPQEHWERARVAASHSFPVFLRLVAELYWGGSTSARSNTVERRKGSQMYYVTLLQHNLEACEFAGALQPLPRAPVWPLKRKEKTNNPSPPRKPKPKTSAFALKVYNPCRCKEEDKCENSWHAGPQNGVSAKIINHVFVHFQCWQSWGDLRLLAGSAGGTGSALRRPLSCRLGLLEKVKKSFVEPVLRPSTLRLFMLYHKKTPDRNGSVWLYC